MAEQEGGGESSAGGSPSPPRDTDFYAVLGLGRAATAEEIRRAYRALAQACHPDKHPSAAMRAVAAEQFHRVHEAFEVLSDESKKAVYDVYGVDGLRTGLEVGARHKSPQEMREEFERLKQKQATRAFEAKVNYRGSYMFGFSASELLEPDAGPYGGGGVELTSVATNSHMSVPLTGKDTAMIGGQVASRRGMGGGSLVLGIKRVCSEDAEIEASAQAGLRSLLSVTGTRKLSEYSNGSMTYFWTPKQGFGLSLFASRQLSYDGRYQGTWSWTVGPVPGLTEGIKYSGEKMNASAELSVGALATGLQGTVVRQLNQTDAVRCVAKCGTMGVHAEVGVTRRVGELSTVGFGVQGGVTGIFLKLSLTRGGQRFMFPLLLAPTFNPRVLLGALVIPPVTYYSVRTFVYLPLSRRYRARELLRVRQEKAREIHEAHARAELAAQMLVPMAERNRKRETERGGLIVERAVYGVLPAKGFPEAPSGVAAEAAEAAEAVGSGEGPTEDAGAADATLPEPWVDVTTALQFLVDGGVLEIAEGTRKDDLTGFCDPAPGVEPKELRVRYTYKGVPHEVTVTADAALELPSAKHRVESAGA